MVLRFWKERATRRPEFSPRPPRSKPLSRSDFRVSTFTPHTPHKLFPTATLGSFFLLPPLPGQPRVDLNWKMTWFRSAAPSLLHKNQHASSPLRDLRSLFLSFSPSPHHLTPTASVSPSLSDHPSLCSLFLFTHERASRAPLGFVVRNLYLPKGGISEWHRQPLSSLPSREQCSPLTPENSPHPHFPFSSPFALAKPPPPPPPPYPFILQACPPSPG